MDNVVPELDRISRNLSKEENHKNNRYVLEFISRLKPGDPRYQRFLAQTIEKLEGAGHEEALKHYKEAFTIAPTFPAHLTDYAKCLMRVKKAKEVISIVEGFDKAIYRKVMDNHNIAIYTGCLEEVGQGEKASTLRMAQINKNSRHTAFYTDEANNLQDKGKYKEALNILERAEALGYADEVTHRLKGKIINKLNKENN